MDDGSLTVATVRAVWSSAMSIFFDRVTRAILDVATKFSLNDRGQGLIWRLDRLGDLIARRKQKNVKLVRRNQF
jgi:hypothetical protein